jgi:hypothetical protein
VNIIDFTLSCLFVIELLIKVIVDGFLFNGPSSYLRLGWNILDFIISLTFFISLLPILSGFRKFKIMRVIRILRSLRVIARNENLMVVINSILKSIAGITYVAILLLIFFFIFGIISVNLFKG